MGIKPSVPRGPQGSPLSYLNRAVGVAILLLVLGVIGFRLFLPLIEKSRAQDLELAALRKEARKLEGVRDHLQKQIRWLSTDPFYQEMCARDKLNLRRKGETIIHFE